MNRTLSGARPANAPTSSCASRPSSAPKSKNQGLLDVYEKIDLPLAGVLARMEAAGVRVDPKELDRISTHIAAEMGKLEKTIFEMAGAEFNINSPQPARRNPSSIN